MRKDLTKLVLLGFTSLLLIACEGAFAQAPPADVAGTWTIHSTGWDGQKAEQIIQLRQNGGQITGHFKGPHQSGSLSGVVSGNHVAFSTKTRDVLNFRGEVSGDTIQGMFGNRGKTGTWMARRSAPNAP